MERYPDELARAMIRTHLAVLPVWQFHEQLAARDARLFQTEALLDGAYAILAVLSGLNRVWFTRKQFKRLRDHVASLRLAPDDLARRLESLLELDLSAAATELRRLFDETVSLVERHMPEIDTTAARAALADR